MLGVAAGGFAGPLIPGRGAPTGSAEMPAPRPDARAVVRGGYAAHVIRVIDGDTFEAEVAAWPGLAITTKVRLRGIDAAEMRARCADEYRHAVAARDALAALLASGEVTIFRVSLDKYGGRVVASAAAGREADVSAALLRDGLVRAYEGGRRRSWCDPAS